MIPATALRLGPVMVAHAFRPMAAVGGDFLDYFELPDGMIGLYVGDVCGKGLPAALYAALVMGALRGIHKAGTPPAAVLATLNRRLLIRAMPRRYAALQYAVFDRRHHVLSLASAGMPGPFHLTADGCHPLTLAGTPPGMFPASAYDTLTLSLRPGEAVLFCTDGITEARNPQGEQYGIARLQALCAATPAASAEVVLTRVIAAVTQFSGECPWADDMAAAVLQLASDGRD
jgi:sigma-B regulation protein RsbU (phosphoserine phosphatase)